MKKYLIIPGCSDLNRGDQALVWETKRIAEECGFTGQFYLTSERNEPVKQSMEKNLKIVTPILEHPSRKFKNKENIRYTRGLKFKWGLVSIIDLIGSIFMLIHPTRMLIKKLLSPDKRHSIEVLENADAVFMKGGGILQTYGGLTSTYSMYFWVYPILLAHRLKKPVYVMPNSFGPFEGPFVKSIARIALKNCKVVTARESLSQEMVSKQLRLKINNYMDLAFMLPQSNLNRAEIYQKYNLPENRKLVALTMRPYRFPDSSNPEAAYRQFKSEMALFITWLYDAGNMPVVVEHTLAVNAHENDGACIKDVVSLVSNEKYRIISDVDYDCYDLKCIYSFCNYIIGTRFHSMIFSFGSNVPGIAISYTGNKSIGIMHDMDLDDYVINIADVQADVLRKKFISLVENEEVVVRKIQNYRIQAEKSRGQLKEHLKK